MIAGVGVLAYDLMICELKTICFINISFEILLLFEDLDELTPNEFLSPFLEVIRSEDTTGPITGLALTSVNKFLSYGLIGNELIYLLFLLYFLALLS